MKKVTSIILGLLLAAHGATAQPMGGGGGGGSSGSGRATVGPGPALDEIGAAISGLEIPAMDALSMSATPVTSGTRADRLKTLAFDRRPSAILAAWAPAVAASAEATKKSTDPIDVELETFQRDVTRGDWARVKTYLAGLEEEEAKAGYHQLLTSLGVPAIPPGMPGPVPVPAAGPVDMMGGMAAGVGPPGPAVPGAPAPLPVQETNRIDLEDFVGLLAAAPRPLDRESIPLAGGVLRQALAGGLLVETLVTRLEGETRGPSPTIITPRQAAQLLVAVEETTQLERFLPPAEVAALEKDTEALNLRARHHLGLHAKKAKQEDIDRAWELTQLALRTAGPPEERADSLRRAVDLAHRMEPAVGKAWTQRCFRDDPELGKEILAAIGTWITQGLQKEFHRPEVRLHVLEVQKSAVDALLEASPARADEWRDVLTLLAVGWTREAIVTCQLAQGSGALAMHQDPYGNIYYTNASGEMGQAPPPPTPEQPAPIPATDLLGTRPEGGWLDRVRVDSRAGLMMTLCKLFLKAEDEDRAIPCIAELAKTMPARARELADEFLDVWVKTHDLNRAQGPNNPFMMMWGYNGRANGIPLTRSRQERNLEELGEFTRRMADLGIGPLDEARLSKAFRVSHSSAEVYRSDAVEKVFGPIAGLSPKTLAGLAQQMRENLAGLWRKTEPQQEKKTNRKLKDIESEVLRGYAVAQEIVAKASERYPEDHHLVLARAALLHDENGYRQEIAASKEFAKKNEEAYDLFEKAARLYAKRVTSLPAEEQSSQLHEQWFYASLGACDPGQIDEKKQADTRQPERIRAALAALPGETAARHFDRFATGLFTRLTSVSPAVKFRYLEGGFRIVGDRRQASDARRVFEYYRDLVTEIRLETRIDGPADVGHTRPFGVFVRLRHTTDIEREAGGFAKYLTNTGTSFSSWSFQSTADYRDRFQASAKERLEPHFEILSITFETDKVHSRAAPDYGWRLTPYAYLLLRPKGPQVDRVPPLRLDLDFADTSGTVILPIESAPIPLDAKAEKGSPRPFQKVEITQILDDRQAAVDKVQSEIKATGLGLMPDLDQLLSLDAGDFEVAGVEDTGVSVTRFHPESDSIAVESERTWTVSLKARPGVERRKRNFRHGKPKDAAFKLVHQRYDDADLVTTGAEVVVEHAPVSRGRRWKGVAGIALAVLLVLGLRARRRRGRDVVAAERWPMPVSLTPFTTIGMLERFMTEVTWSEPERQELRRTVASIEDHYFSTRGEAAKGIDLEKILKDWLRRARERA